MPLTNVHPLGAQRFRELLAELRHGRIQSELFGVERQDVVVVGVANMIRLVRHADPLHPAQPFGEPLAVGDARVVHRLQPPQLRPRERLTEHVAAIHPAHAARVVLLVLPLPTRNDDLSEILERLRAFVDDRVVRREQAPLAACCQVFGHLRAEAGAVAHRAAHAVAVARAVRLGAVFDDG